MSSNYTVPIPESPLAKAASNRSQVDIQLGVIDDYECFTELVKKMREAQKQYFKTRGKPELKYALQLEKQVDEQINELI